MSLWGYYVHADADGGLSIAGVVRTTNSQLSLIAQGLRKEFRHPFSYPGQLQTVNMGAVVTWQHTMEVDGDFDAVELVFHSAAAATIDLRVSVATSEALTSTKYPVVGGSNVTSSSGWVDVKVSGSTTITVPVQTASKVPSCVKSDTAYLSSLARTDTTSNKRILLVRIVSPNSANLTAGGFTATVLGALASDSGLSQTGYYWYGDGIASYPAFASAVDNGVNPLPAFSVVLYKRTTSAQSIAFAGDSTYAMTGSSLTFAPFGLKAVNSLVSSGKAVTPVYLGWPGSTSSESYTRFTNFADKAPPSFAMYQPYSINDSSPTVQTAMTNAVKFRNYCLTNKIVPILSTPMPNGAVGQAMGATELAIRAAILSLAANDCLVIDNAALLGDANYGWLAPYRYDNNHQTDAARTVQAAAIAAAILPLI